MFIISASLFTHKGGKRACAQGRWIRGKMCTHLTCAPKWTPLAAFNLMLIWRNSGYYKIKQKFHTVSDQKVTCQKVTHFWRILEIIKKLEENIFMDTVVSLPKLAWPKIKKNGHVGWITPKLPFFRNGCIKNRIQNWNVKCLV